MEFNEAIRAHKAWKAKLNDAIFKKAKLDAATIGKDNCCDLGKWLHGPAKAQIGSGAGFTELLGLHKSFHEEAGKVAIHINMGAFLEATKGLMPNSAFSSSSAKVVAALQAMEDQQRSKKG